MHVGKCVNAVTSTPHVHGMVFQVEEMRFSTSDTLHCGEIEHEKLVGL